MRKFLLVAAALLFTPLAQAKTVTVDKSRTVYIYGAVDGRALSYAEKIVKLANTNKEPIYLAINSPGGEVYAGLQVISAIGVAQSRGISVRCVSTLLSASMAFQILAHCNERYTFANTLLLWHPMKASFGNPQDAEDLIYQGTSMAELEALMIIKLITTLKVARELFFYHYHHETLWTAELLAKVSPKFLTIVDDVHGLDSMFEIR